MKVFEITNEFIGCSYVRLYVVAETREQALEFANNKFTEKSSSGLGITETLECKIGAISVPSDEGMTFEKI